MLLRKLLPLSLLVAVGGCSGSVGTPGGESTASLTKIPSSGGQYTEFETLQVRPLALSPDGKTLFAANTPDNRLEMFKVSGNKLIPIGSVVVGLEPIAVAARTNNEVWVVNHLSDSVSIVNVAAGGAAATVSRTLLVGDEPRDIVFAGPNRSRAFITTAHRGQNTGDAYDLQTSGVGRADVWVFDVNHLGTPAGGTRLAKLTFFADTPRALAVSPDGLTVYAAAFNSGNQTTSASAFAVSQVYDFAHGGHMPGPATITLQSPMGPITIPQPPTGLVVKNIGGHWFDAYGKAYDPFIKVNLPDLDVFAIDASGSMPTAKANGAYAHVGTTLFNMAVNPRNGKVYVTNTEAHNDVRFEGHNAGFTTVAGHITDSRITVIDPSSGAIAARDLNTHITDYSQPVTADQKSLSLAFPEGVAVSGDGSTLYMIAQGSNKLAVYSTAALEAGNVVPTHDSQVVLSGGGPTGLAVADATHLAYVLTRFDNSISVVDLNQKSEVGKATMFNPEPASVTAGRKYLYDATLTSQNGTTACASCHIGGDKDELAWDLGNPGGIPLTIRDVGVVFTIPPALILALLPNLPNIFAANMPVKGPMTTLSLRGMDNHGAEHWRGDRNGMTQQNGLPFLDASGNPVTNAQPNSGIYDEFNAFKSFNVAFPGLVGNDAELSDSDMNDFTTFALSISYPPNPVRNLDNTLTADQAAGYAFFENHVDTPQGPVELPSDRFHNCEGCHTLDPNGNAGSTAHPGFFGTDGKISFEFESQTFKVPHLRNLYTKVGMFNSSLDTLQPGTIYLPEQQAPIDAVRGFGFQHDGSLGRLEHFFTGQVFLQTNNPVTLADGTVVPPNPYGIPYLDPNSIGTPTGPVLQGDGGFDLRRQIVSFMLAFDSNHAPVVGQQITLTALDGSSAAPSIALFEHQAMAGACDLVAKSGSIAGIDAGFLYNPANGTWQPNSMSLPALTDAQLQALVTRGVLPSLTFTCVPLGEGQRVAIDRDGDGWADADELIAHTNPADPNSHP